VMVALSRYLKNHIEAIVIITSCRWPRRRDGIRRFWHCKSLYTFANLMMKDEKAGEVAGGKYVGKGRERVKAGTDL